MNKTVTVTLVRRYAHPVYGKQVTRSKKVKARNLEGERARPRRRHRAHHGDAAAGENGVNWRVTEVVERAK